MAATEPGHNLTVQFSTTLPIIVDAPAQSGRAGVEGKVRTSSPVRMGEQRCACRSVAARGFARADVGWCYEICLCVDICQRAARRNASAAARKTGPGIAAPAGVPRTVPPNGQVHLARHACRVPRRTPPASRVAFPLSLRLFHRQFNALRALRPLNASSRCIWLQCCGNRRLVQAPPAPRNRRVLVFRYATFLP